MHEFTSADNGYDECVLCGMLAEPEVVASITVPCRWKPCPAPANHNSPCVAVLTDEGECACSYCERPCGSSAGDEDEDDVPDPVEWSDELASSPLY